MGSGKGMGGMGPGGPGRPMRSGGPLQPGARDVMSAGGVGQHSGANHAEFLERQQKAKELMLGSNLSAMSAGSPLVAAANPTMMGGPRPLPGGMPTGGTMFRQPSMPMGGGGKPTGRFS
ncbi:hypothetical protein ACFL3Q_12400 [Planctomycetota bacterium]